MLQDSLSLTLSSAIFRSRFKESPCQQVSKLNTRCLGVFSAAYAIARHPDGFADVNPEMAEFLPGSVIPRISVRRPFDASLIVAESRHTPVMREARVALAFLRLCEIMRILGERNESADTRN